MMLWLTLVILAGERNMAKERWFNPKTSSGWKHDMPKKKRRELLLDAHDGSCLSAARSKQALANVTKSRATRKAAKEDAEYFFEKHRKGTC